MTFTYDEADLSTTIKNYSKFDNNYYINYLDGSTSNYVCYGDHEEERIKKIMIDQAIDRQGMLEIKNIDLFKKSSVITAAVTSLGASFFGHQQQYALTSLALAGTCYAVYNVRKMRYKLNELKKYKLFLELNRELTVGEYQNLFNEIEFDKFYQIPLNINTIDSFSYDNVKQLCKRFYENQNK